MGKQYTRHNNKLIDKDDLIESLQAKIEALESKIKLREENIEAVTGVLTMATAENERLLALIDEAELRRVDWDDIEQTENENTRLKDEIEALREKLENLGPWGNGD